MAQATALPEFSGGHTLPQQIALHLKPGPAFILVTGRGTHACQALFNNLSTTMMNAGRVLRLNASDPSSSLFDQAACALEPGLTHISAASLAKYLSDGNTLLLCTISNKHRPDAFEQLRQLSNLQSQNSSLNIIVCGNGVSARQLPDALRQRLTATFALDKISRIMRYAAWGILLSTLGGIAWLAHDKAPNLPASFTVKPMPPSSTRLLETSLKAGPVLAHPISGETQTPLTHVFQTEAEAEAALQAQAPAEKPDQE